MRSIGVFIVGLCIAIPVLAVTWIAIFGTSDTEPGYWHVLWSSMLPEYIRNTLWLSLGVAFFTFLIGVSTAWTVTMFNFPGRVVFEMLLLLPLAMPAYVVAYAYTDFLDYAGPVQSALRALLGFDSPHDYWFPDIRSRTGAMAVMTAAFYPYVYLTARSAFLEQSAALLEASKTLGCNSFSAFRRVVLPVAWPSIVVGIALALMEVVSDFGVVDFFAVQTLTTGLFNVWLTMNDRAGGAQIALVLLVFVSVLVVGERRARARKRYFAQSAHHMPRRQNLSAKARLLAFAVCFIPVFAGFLMPVGLLSFHAIKQIDVVLSHDFFSMAGRSFALGVLASMIVTAVALLLAYSARLGLNRPARIAVRLANFGYAVPGAVLAIGILIPFGALDRTLNNFAEAHFGVSTGLVISGTIFALIFAYLVRFLALSHGTIEAGLGRIKPSLDMAALTLGRNPWQILREVHLPLMRGSLLTAALLVMVDVIKELPATLILRPFNFDTLATTAYSLASDEKLELAALPSLAIVIVGLLPVMLLSHAIGAARQYPYREEIIDTDSRLLA